MAEIPPIPVGLSNQPYYVRERKDWAVQQEIYRHQQAIYSIGEYAMFVLLWTLEDHQQGYVSRCTRCYRSNDIEGRVAKVYNQANEAKCPRCYGTTFEGGIRARIIRPALFSDVDDEEKPSNRGIVNPQQATIESTEDFRYRTGDFVFRSDGSRWQLGSPQRVTLRTGFNHPTQNSTSIGYTQAPANLEDPTSVAFLIPPSADSLKDILSSPSRYPRSSIDMVNGPLIPRARTD